MQIRYGFWRNEPHGFDQIHKTLLSSRFTIFQTSITIEFIMRLTQFIPAILLGGLFCSLIQSADAVTTFRGTRTYLTVLNTNIKYPLFSKEFKEADGIISVGGIKEIWLDDNQKTLGFRLSRERIRPNGSGLGLSLTYWRGKFSNTSFLYRKRGAQNFIAKYRNPTHTYLFLDLNGIYIAWESGTKALGFYCLLSLIGDREQYSIDRYQSLGDDPTQRDLSSDNRDKISLRFGLGIGGRIHLNRLFSLWLEKRWIVGERLSDERTFGTGGLYEGGRQKTLYVPFNSIGLAIGL